MADPATRESFLIIFGMPVAIVGVTQYFKYKMAQLRGKKRRGSEGLEKEPQRSGGQLEARVQNLESISLLRRTSSSTRGA